MKDAKCEESVESAGEEHKDNANNEHSIKSVIPCGLKVVLVKYRCP